MTHQERDVTEYFSFSDDLAAADNQSIVDQVSGRALRKVTAAPFTIAEGDDKKLICRPVLTSIYIEPDAATTLVRIFTTVSGTDTEDAGTNDLFQVGDGVATGYSAVSAHGKFIGSSGTDVKVEITGGGARIVVAGFWSTHQREDVT